MARRHRPKPNKKQVNAPVEEQPAKKVAREKVAPAHPDMQIPFLKNVLSLIALFFLVYYLVGNVKGYTWLKERFIEQNLEKLDKYSELTEDQKYQAYFRFNHQFLTFIRDNTADSSIIYMPPDSIIRPDSEQNEFYTKKRSNSVWNKVWATYFIYPRKLVYHREKDEIPNFDRYTHVACVNGWGYEYLEYDVPKNRRAKYQILPRTVDGLKAMNERNQKKQWPWFT